MHKKWIDLIPFYITGVLSESDKNGLEQHLKKCEGCYLVLQEWMEIANVVHSMAIEKSQLLPPLAPRVREQVLKGETATLQPNPNRKFQSFPTQWATSENHPSPIPKYLGKRMNIPITLVAVGILVVAFVGVLILMVNRNLNGENAFLASNNSTLVSPDPPPTITATSRGSEDFGIISPTLPLHSTPSLETGGIGGDSDSLPDFGTNNFDEICHIGIDSSASIAVYVSPTISSEINGYIDAGELWLAVVHSGDDWYNVFDQESGLHGWVLDEGIIFSGNCDNLPLPTPMGGAEISPYEQCLASSNNEDESLVIYSLPSYESTLVYTMPPQITAIVLGYSEDEQWYNVRYAQERTTWSGWVNIEDVILYFACDNLSENNADYDADRAVTTTLTPASVTPSLSTPHPQIIAFATSDDIVRAGQTITVSWAVQDTTAIWLEYYDPENNPTTNSVYRAIGLYSALPMNGAIDVVIPHDYEFDIIYFNLILGTHDQSGRNKGEVIAVSVNPNDE